MNRENISLPFVVVGSSKSGTTWLQRILDSHPQIRCHFQLPIFPLLPQNNPNLFYPAITTYGEYESPFKGVFQSKKDENEYNWMTTFIQDLPLFQKHFIKSIYPNCQEDRQLFLEELHKKIIGGGIEKLLIDNPDKIIFGTKAYTDLNFFFEVFPNSKVIHIIRDGRDVCVSKRFHLLRRKIYYLGDEKNKFLYFINKFKLSRVPLRTIRKYTGWLGAEQYKNLNENGNLFSEMALKKFTVEWKNIVNYYLLFEQKRPSQVYNLRYESLLTNPEIEFQKLFAFLEADSSPSIVQDVMDKTNFSKLRGATENGFFRKGEKGDWKNYFQNKDKVLFKELAGDLLCQLNYEKNNNW